MAKFIEVTAAGKPAYVNTDGLLKIESTTTVMTITYAGGTTITLTATTTFVAQDAIDAMYDALKAVINAGPDAAGTVVYTKVPDFETGIS